jgi:hypothetical protein
MLVGPIPSSFIVNKSSLSLPELRWAFDNGIIGAQAIVDVAASIVGSKDDSTIITRLAGVTHAELPEVRDILEGVPIDDGQADVIRHKWVWLVLSWLYEHHGGDDDVFEKVDGLYSDLGYPEEMVTFGPYAPAYQAKGDPATMRNEVLSEWRRYLARGDETFGRQSAA